MVTIIFSEQRLYLSEHQNIFFPLKRVLNSIRLNILRRLPLSCEIVKNVISVLSSRKVPFAFKKTVTQSNLCIRNSHIKYLSTSDKYHAPITNHISNIRRFGFLFCTFRAFPSFRKGARGSIWSCTRCIVFMAYELFHAQACII